MKYALVDNRKVEAFPKGKGLCICCNQETVAKCGSKRLHHWAHKSLKHCDSWWENETEWHRNWKSLFPVDWQEVVHFDKETGEKHIADVKTDKGFVFEFQNSPMSLEELKSREQFYKEMLWIVNGEKFKNNFYILGELPDPRDTYFSDIAFCSTGKNNIARGYWKYSENPDWQQNSEKIMLVRIYDYNGIKPKVEASYVGHHLFDWAKPKEVWFYSQCDVFIDFGGKVIWKLMKYGRNGLYCVRRIDKEYFINRATGRTTKPNKL